MTDAILRFMFKPDVGLGLAWLFHACWYAWGRHVGSTTTAESMREQHRRDQRLIVAQLNYWRGVVERERAANAELYQENIRLRRSQRVIDIRDA